MNLLQQHRLEQLAFRLLFGPTLGPAELDEYDRLIALVGCNPDGVPVDEAKARKRGRRNKVRKPAKAGGRLRTAARKTKRAPGD